MGSSLVVAKYGGDPPGLVIGGHIPPAPQRTLAYPGLPTGDHIMEIFGARFLKTVETC